MITVQSTTTRRRSSVHQNLFDPKLYRTCEPAKEVSEKEEKDKYAQPSLSQIVGKVSEIAVLLQKEFVRLFPRSVQDYLPEVDLKVTLVCLTWYVTSSISSNVSKAILRDFTHPVALTELQFLFSALLCVFFIAVVNMAQLPSLSRTAIARAVASFPEGILPSYLSGDFRQSVVGKFLKPSKLIFLATFPMGIFQFMGHISSHKATALIPVSLVHSIKALSPIVTVSYYRVFQGKKYNAMTYWTLVPLIMGVMITCWSTHGSKKMDAANGRLSMLSGLLYASVSMLIFVSQNIFAKSILTVKSKKGILPSSAPASPQIGKAEVSPFQIDKITILFYCSCIGFALTLPPFLTGELMQHQSVFKDLTWKVSSLIVFHGVTHFFQALLAFQLIGMLSSVNYSVANIMKRIVIITVALAWESRFNIAQVIGLLMTLSGLYGYDKWGTFRKIDKQMTAL
ncbi:hypothetical protein HG536_0H01160 [Torulaspora globosa]|uniref:Sugar phosphate transporter domain-containing protein n=1 Tax=Torulaspora globosa TaxID=48254 RepID=A0A7G3ZMK5_9SACH|nr:uncharacterized protein HG536_0H01160 [Torulaspora globosa]QLL34741.1 hypothetical protein HG536_0H01160 [Torulaspora globosa]